MLRKHVAAVAALYAFALMPGPATAGPQGTDPRATPGPASYAPPRQGSYGGGFLEFLMGGRDASGPRPAARAAAVAYADPGATAEPGYEAPRRPLDPAYQRQDVEFRGGQEPGTIVVDTTNKFLYLIEGGGHALRYGIGVGRPGFLWHGEKTITRKAEWPDWTPPSEMLLRRPDLPAHMDGGIANPLGARAMYLGSSLYRIHGTNEPDTIGTNVSSGCIRLTNDDVADLFGRVRVGTKVFVL